MGYDNLMGFGWYMRRTADAERLAEFYGEVLGLPLIRGRQPVFMFWAGEDLVFELKSDEAPVDLRHNDPATAPCVPVFRIHDLPDLLSRLQAAGTRVISEGSSANGREAHVLDSDGQLIGLRERFATSARPEDRAARERRRRAAQADAFNPGCAPMPSDVQELGWVTCRYADQTAIAKFYGDVVGLRALDNWHDRRHFDLGNSVVLELAGGGEPQPLPADRIEVTNSFILRYQDTLRFKEQVKAHGVPFPNEHIQWQRAHLAYYGDPEGHIVGIEERYDPSRYPPGVDAFAEDLEAERRFASGRD